MVISNGIAEDTETDESLPTPYGDCYGVCSVSNGSITFLQIHLRLFFTSMI